MPHQMNKKVEEKKRRSGNIETETTVKRSDKVKWKEQYFFFALLVPQRETFYSYLTIASISIRLIPFYFHFVHPHLVLANEIDI